MKPIKVNYRTLDGKPTSTTVAGSIAEFYAKAAGFELVEYVQDKDGYQQRLTKAIQQLVNEQAHKTNACELELNKNFIERLLLSKAKQLYIAQAFEHGEQLDLI